MTKDISIVPAADHLGYPRPGLLHALVGTRVVATAAKVAGTEETWVLIRAGQDDHEVVDGDIRTLLVAIAEQVTP
jgi:hypothetical protein